MLESDTQPFPLVRSFIVTLPLVKLAQRCMTHSMTTIHQHLRSYCGAPLEQVTLRAQLMLCYKRILGPLSEEPCHHSPSKDLKT